MNAISSNALGLRLRPILGALRSEQIPEHEHAEPLGELPFVTISRQAGAGAWTFAQALVERLNQIDRADRGWTAWDRELVERVAADHHISQELIDSLEESHHTWLGEFLENLSFTTDSAHPDELTVYRRVAGTIRALAQAGRVVIVGRGGVCITRDMPGGIHVRLVAPLKHRIQNMARRLNLTPQEAAEHVRQLDRNREAFYRRYWPTHPLVPELFTVTLNTSRIPEPRMVESLVPLIVSAVARQTPESPFRAIGR